MQAGFYCKSPAQGPYVLRARNDDWGLVRCPQRETPSAVVTAFNQHFLTMCHQPQSHSTNGPLDLSHQVPQRCLQFITS